MALRKERRRATHCSLLWTVGFCLLGVAPASAAPRAYITNPYNDTVSVIDTVSDSVIATIHVANAPGAVAVHPNGREVYVTTEVNNTVSVIDTFSNRVTATIPIELASSLAVSPSGDRLYAINYFTGLVSVIDTATRQLLAEVRAGEGLVDIAVAADGSHMFVTNQYSSQERRPCSLGPPPLLYCDVPVDILDTVSFTGELLPIGDYLDGVAADPRGGRFYVANVWPLGPGYNNFQAVVTIVTEDPVLGLFHVLTRIPLGSFFEPVAVAPLPDGSRVYVSGGGMVSVIDAASDTLIDQLPVSGALSVTPDGKKVYAVGDDIVSVLDTAMDTITATILLRPGLYAIGQFIGPDIDFPTPTPVPLGPCTGDCDGDGAVSTAELVSCVRIALGAWPIDRCPACAGGTGSPVLIDDVVSAVDASVRGCAQ